MKIIFYKLGTLENAILPTKEAIDTLKKEIKKGREDGEMHLVWGPELSISMIDTGPNNQ